MSGPRATGPTRIVRVETIDMTPDEYRAAVRALAGLIVRWWTDHPDQAA